MASTNKIVNHYSSENLRHETVTIVSQPPCKLLIEVGERQEKMSIFSGNESLARFERAPPRANRDARAAIKARIRWQFHQSIVKIALIYSTLVCRL